MLIQRDSLRAQTAEDESAIDTDTRRLAQPVIFFAERCLVTIRISRGRQIAVIAIGPAMISAAEGLRVAALDLTHRVGAMDAAVHQESHLAVVAAHHDHGLLTYVGHAEVARAGNLARVADIDPSAGEDFVHLFLEDGRVGIDAAMHAIILDEIVVIDSGSRDFHSASWRKVVRRTRGALRSKRAPAVPRAMRCAPAGFHPLKGAAPARSAARRDPQRPPP